MLFTLLPYRDLGACRGLVVTVAMLMCSLLLAPVPALAEGEDRDGRQIHDDPLNNEAIVRLAYDNLAEYTRGARSEIRFEIDDFVHLKPEDFELAFWTDLVSPPSGLLVDMHRSVIHDQNLAQTQSVYEPSLRYVDRTAVPGLSLLHGMTVSEVVEEVLEENPEDDAAHLVGITSFRVRVTLGSNTREYRAAFFWVPAAAEARENTALIAHDLVTQGVEEAAREPYQPRPAVSFPQASGRADGAEKSGAGKRCKKTKDTLTVTKEPEAGTDGHVSGSGFHAGHAAIDITCSCDEACNNTCVPVVKSACYDIGQHLGLCHKMRSQSTGTAKSDFIKGPECGGAYLCAMKRCFRCWCGIALEISVGSENARMKFTFTQGEAEWSYQHEYIRTCPPCEEAPPSDLGPDNGDVDLGGDGGGNGGGSGGGGTGDDGSDWDGDIGAGDGDPDLPPPPGDDGDQPPQDDPPGGGNPSPGETGEFDVFCGIPPVRVGSASTHEQAEAICRAYAEEPREIS